MRGLRLCVLNFEFFVLNSEMLLRVLNFNFFVLNSRNVRHVLKYVPVEIVYRQFDFPPSLFLVFTTLRREPV